MSRGHGSNCLPSGVVCGGQTRDVGQGRENGNEPPSVFSSCSSAAHTSFTAATLSHVVHPLPPPPLTCVGGVVVLLQEAHQVLQAGQRRGGGGGSVGLLQWAGLEQMHECARRDAGLTAAHELCVVEGGGSDAGLTAAHELCRGGEKGGGGGRWWERRQDEAGGGRGAAKTWSGRGG